MIKTSQTHVFQTNLGWMGLDWSKDLLKQLTFGHSTAEKARKQLSESGLGKSHPSAFQRDVRNRLVAYASGAPEVFVDVELDIRARTPFQRAVLRACRDIPWGMTRSYGELAEFVGSPRAARAVGTVMSTNRFPIIIPCHRVVATGKRFGGFTAPGGISMKRRMLLMEDSDVAVNG